jgi:cytochrome c-type biogenesis protein CcmH/NrfG
LKEIRSIGGSYLPALVNLETTQLLCGSLPEASSAFEQAVKREPANTAAILGLTRTRYATVNRSEAGALHARLASLDPQLASRYAYLTPDARDASRAADAASITGGSVSWAE